MNLEDQMKASLAQAKVMGHVMDKLFGAIENKKGETMGQPHPQQHLMDYVTDLEQSHARLLQALRDCINELESIHFTNPITADTIAEAHKAIERAKIG